MSNFTQRIQDDLKTAMKAKDTVALATLRALKAAMTNASIEKSGLGTPLDDSEITSLIRKQIKQRQDSIEQFQKANRAELAANETAEMHILEQYLPAPALRGRNLIRRRPGHRRYRRRRQGRYGEGDETPPGTHRRPRRWQNTLPGGRQTSRLTPSLA